MNDIIYVILSLVLFLLVVFTFTLVIESLRRVYAEIYYTQRALDKVVSYLENREEDNASDKLKDKMQ